MSDENQEVQVETTVAAPEATHSEPVELSPVEQEARASGWVPKEEFHGDENKWVDAAEFVRRAPLFAKIDSQTRELKEVKKALEALKQHHSQVREVEYKRALEALKESKKDAYLEGDADRLVKIDEQIDLVKEEQRKFEAARAQEAVETAKAQIHPDFEAWTARNSWYQNSTPMRAFADALGLELHAKGVPPLEVLKQVEIKIKEEFPHKFRNANRDKPQPVEGASKGKGKSNADYQLSPEENAVMQRFIRQGVMTKEQYIAELKKVNGV
jgi:hypothetical protein